MKVSVAVPTFEYYGRGVEVLDDMFRTISTQTLQDLEIVVSDHSRDDEIKNYCERNYYLLNIKYIRNENGRGDPCINTNNAIDHCSGEIIKIFQQDDFFYDTEALEVMYDQMTNSVHKWFVSGAIHTRDDGHSFFCPMFPRWDPRMLHQRGHNTIGGPSVVAIKNGVSVRFDPMFRMLLDIDFYYHLMVEYGMPIFYQDTLIANRVRDTDTLQSEITDEQVQEEFKHLKEKYDL